MTPTPPAQKIENLIAALRADASQCVFENQLEVYPGAVSARLTEAADGLSFLSAALRAETQAREEAETKLAEKEADREYEYLCVDGVKHTHRCSNHFAGDERWGPCLRCRAETAQELQAQLTAERSARQQAERELTSHRLALSASEQTVTARDEELARRQETCADLLGRLAQAERERDVSDLRAATLIGDLVVEQQAHQQTVDALTASEQATTREALRVNVLRDQLSASEQALAHWKDCHGVTADALAASEQARQTVERAFVEMERAYHEAEQARARAEQERDEAWALLESLLSDTPQPNGAYVHVLTCNASRMQPVGNDMCSCPIGRRFKASRGAP
jgi:hypothetical protein